MSSEFINVSHRWTLPIVHWAVPLLYSVPLFAVTDVTFLSIENLEVIAEKGDITLATSMTACFVLTIFILCSFCYSSVLRFLVINRFSNSASVKRESRLYVQMLGLFFAFILLVIYNIMQFSFSLRSNNGPVFTMRIIFPVVSCFLSYVNVWMMFILNSDIRRKTFRLFGYKKSSQSQGTIIISITRKPVTVADAQHSHSGISSSYRRNTK
ncbi:hypothetical protein RB195_001014 [Necator americanus]|uniref:G-protein coupled receptors family 1 profile domain-containing protein n=1 Tax=Necator americanus TaxID=51031 RepID=A0ABR1DCC4_NECAM